MNRQPTIFDQEHTVISTALVTREYTDENNAVTQVKSEPSEVAEAGALQPRHPAVAAPLFPPLGKNEFICWPGTFPARMPE